MSDRPDPRRTRWTDRLEQAGDYTRLFWIIIDALTAPAFAVVVLFTDQTRVAVCLGAALLLTAMRSGAEQIAQAIRTTNRRAVR